MYHRNSKIGGLKDIAKAEEAWSEAYLIYPNVHHYKGLVKKAKSKLNEEVKSSILGTKKKVDKATKAIGATVRVAYAAHTKQQEALPE